jgi:MinD superfamily P-loop ATPase
MKVIAIISEKGGAGKTTLAVNLAVAAEEGGLATVIFDLARAPMRPYGETPGRAKFPRSFLPRPRACQASCNRRGRTKPTS